jgi:putative serine protease PepD
MTDREHALPPDRQQPSWPLADASQRHPAEDQESRPAQPIAQPALGSPTGQPAPAPQPGAQAAPPAGSGFAGPYPPGSGPYGQHTSAFQRPGYGHQQPGHPGPAFQTAAYPSGGYPPPGFQPPGYQPGRGYAPTGPLGLPVHGSHTATAAPRRPGGGKRVALAAGVLGLMLSSGVVGGVVATRFDNNPAQAATAAARTPAVIATQTGSLADVVAAVSPSVVSINVTLRGGSGTGSGVIIDSDGTILTNAHVVSSASSIEVLMSDGKTVPAKLIGADTSADVALIQVQGAGTLTPASIATGSTLRVGDTVLAFGSPLGLEGSVTEGIVSSLNRQVEGRSSTLSGMIQTDAAINPGNSGGPLVNAAGQVVGMNTAIATTSEDGGNIGVGFAIPIDKAMQVANQIRR